MTTHETVWTPGPALQAGMAAMEKFHADHPKVFSLMLDDGTPRYHHNTATGPRMESRERFDLGTQWTNNGKA